MKLNPPWYFCNGWWSPWCLLDEYWHRYVDPINDDDDDDDDDEFDWLDSMDTSEPQDTRGWLCRKHDEAAQAHYYRRHPEHAIEDDYVGSTNLNQEEKKGNRDG